MSLAEESTLETLPPEEVLKRLREMEEVQAGSYDNESQHAEADQIICSLLRYLGQVEIADLFEELSDDWWYA